MAARARGLTFLTDQDDNGLKREIADAKWDLEQILGWPVEHFS